MWLKLAQKVHKDVVFILSKFHLFKVLNFFSRYPGLYSFQPNMLEHNWIHRVGIMQIFPR